MIESTVSRKHGSLHGVLFIALMVGAPVVSAFRIWPLFWAVPLGVYLAIVAVVPTLRVTFRPWRFGRVSRFSISASLVIALGSCVVLMVYQHLALPQVSGFMRLVPVNALGGVILAGIVFSLGNALIEELVFRGVLFDAIESASDGAVAVAGSAMIFGFLHLHGYPPGWWGALLAGTYGLCLGWLRLITGGIGLTVLVHITADATIYMIIAESSGW